MSARVDIKDRENLEAWLEDQPREVAVWIASRAAARVLPVWWDAVLTEEWARRRDLTALPVLRSVLISSVAAIMPTDDISRAVSDAYASATAYALVSVTDDASVSSAAFAAAAADASSASSAAFASSASSVWGAVREDAEFVASGESPDLRPLWPDGPGPLDTIWDKVKTGVANVPDSQDWQFWIEWYDALLDGRPMLGDAARTWEMLEQIALIDPETWDKGPEVVNPVIREIWEGYQESGMGVGRAADPEPVSDDAKSAMKQRVAVNRDALTVSGAGLVDQLGAFRDRVRGMNHLEPEVREEVLAFIDEFTSKLWVLLEGLPPPGETVDDADAGRLVLWLREYRGLLRHKLAYYGSPENMAEATAPTGIILGATGIGAMLGMPVAGSVVGGLIANQMKPGQAAKELTARSIKDGDAG